MPLLLPATSQLLESSRPPGMHSLPLEVQLSHLITHRRSEGKTARLIFVLTIKCL